MEYGYRMLQLLFLFATRLCDVTACPDICKCNDRGLKLTVDCSNRNVSTITYMQLDNNTEVLRISDNYISIVYNYTFTNLVELEELYLARNGLREIEMNAFNNLKYLSIIDLSDNLIQYIHPDTFSKNTYLHTIILRGNELLKVSSSFISSKYVNLLDLSYCKLRELPINIFETTANLQYLYLRGNELRSLDVQTLEPLTSLNSLDLEDNPWSCKDCDSLRNFFTWFLNTQPDLRLPICNEPLDVVGFNILEANKAQCSDQLYFRNINKTTETDRTSSDIYKKNELLILSSFLVGTFCMILLILLLLVIALRKQVKIQSIISGTETMV